MSFYFANMRHCRNSVRFYIVRNSKDIGYSNNALTLSGQSGYDQTAIRFRVGLTIHSRVLLDYLVIHSSNHATFVKCLPKEEPKEKSLDLR